MNYSSLTLFLATLLVAGPATWAAPKTATPVAAPAKSELDTLTETLQRAGAGANEADVIKLLQMAREAGRPFQAAPIAKAYLGQTTQPSATVLVLAAENAWLTADYRTAVTRYKSYLRATEPNADASTAAALLYSIQLDFLGDKEDAYRFMKEYGDELRDTPAARRFDGWFLNEAKERRDLVALGKRLASAMGDKLPLEQERLYYWDYLDAGMQMLSRLPNAAEALPHFRKAVEAMREGKTRTLKYNLYVAYLDVKTGRTSDFAPVTAADYARTLEWDRAAKLAGYPLPA